LSGKGIGIEPGYTALLTVLIVILTCLKECVLFITDLACVSLTDSSIEVEENKTCEQPAINSPQGKFS